MSDHILDLVITREVDELTSTTRAVDYLFSDHVAVVGDLLITEETIV